MSRPGDLASFQNDSAYMERVRLHRTLVVSPGRLFVYTSNNAYRLRHHAKKSKIYPVYAAEVTVKPRETILYVSLASVADANGQRTLCLTSRGHGWTCLVGTNLA